MKINLQNVSQQLMVRRKAHTASTRYRSLGEHACIIFNSKGAPIASGYNTFKVKTPTTEHAEAMAFRKLTQTMKAKGIRKNISVNVLVVRTNGGNSKPCTNCVQRMVNYSNYITIRKVFYTTEPTQPIHQETFSSLVSDPNQHTSSYYRFRLAQLRLQDDSVSDDEETDSNILKRGLSIVMQQENNGCVSRIYARNRSNYVRLKK